MFLVRFIYTDTHLNTGILQLHPQITQYIDTIIRQLILLAGVMHTDFKIIIILQDMYEIQVLDCYNNETYVNGQTGSVYKQTPPLANAMRKPGEWNVYDIIYSAPIFKEDGTYRVPPRVTVIQNGIVLQNNTTILGTTEYIGFPKVVKHGAGPIRLQSHGDPSEPISFRNIWIREM